ncbi:hypothetical protein V6N11_007861 [Hibiscus sabdariffa]|uniref:RNase H type-1 domain-containing protein n=1 Tax=Hibiscus sabdariffa TaxID=183260 RepID=A0ABR2PZD4_9ROSI
MATWQGKRDHSIDAKIPVSSDHIIQVEEMALNLPIDIRFPKVSELISSESNTWNHALLQSIFPHAIEDCIGCIPLAITKPRDELVWRCENTELWYKRNELVHEGPSFSAVKVSSFILAFLLDLESSAAVPAPKTVVKNVKWFPLMIEGDSLSVIKKLNSTMANKSIISPILDDIKVLGKSFEIITFSFVGHERNEVAHELARVRLQYSEPEYWIEEASAMVERLAQRDRPP